MNESDSQLPLLTKEDGAGLNELLYEAGDRIADVALVLKRHGWDCHVDASDIVKRIDEFRSELSEGFEKESLALEQKTDEYDYNLSRGD